MARAAWRSSWPSPGKLAGNYRLIEEFERLTGLPVVLNTSLNENEPIDCTPTEAIDCLQRTRMDVLAVGNLYCEQMGA